jgi:hypothetical protein
MAPRALARSLNKITRPVLAKRGAAFAALAESWAEIVGLRLADDTALAKLAQPRGGGPGTLHLRVTPGLALELQHVAPQLIERINAFLGHRAVERLTFVQRPVASPSLRRNAAGAAQFLPDTTSRRAAETAAAAVPDPALRDALARLGSHVLRRR